MQLELWLWRVGACVGASCRLPRPACGFAYKLNAACTFDVCSTLLILAPLSLEAIRVIVVLVWTVAKFARRSRLIRFNTYNYLRI